MKWLLVAFVAFTGCVSSVKRTNLSPELHSLQFCFAAVIKGSLEYPGPRPLPYIIMVSFVPTSRHFVVGVFPSVVSYRALKDIAFVGPIVQ